MGKMFPEGVFEKGNGKKLNKSLMKLGRLCSQPNIWNWEENLNMIKKEHWTGIYMNPILDTEDRLKLPHIVFYAFDDETDFLIAVNIGFVETKSKLKEKAEYCIDELICYINQADGIDYADGAKLVLRKKIVKWGHGGSQGGDWLPGRWSEDFPDLNCSQLDSVTLKKYIAEIDQKIVDDYLYTPVFLIQYGIQKEKLYDDEIADKFVNDALKKLRPICKLFR